MDRGGGSGGSYNGTSARVRLVNLTGGFIRNQNQFGAGDAAGDLRLGYVEEGHLMGQSWAQTHHCG